MLKLEEKLAVYRFNNFQANNTSVHFMTKDNKNNTKRMHNYSSTKKWRVQITLTKYTQHSKKKNTVFFETIELYNF